MIAAVAARAMAARGIHYGWLMAGLVFLAGLSENAAMSVPSVLLTPISHDLGWSISELSGPLGLRIALFGLVAPFAGGLILVYGPRAILIASALLVIAGLLLVLSMNARWELWFGLGVLMGVAPGLAGPA